MQRLFTTGRSIQRSNLASVAASTRAFASSPQPNPFDKSIKTHLDHAGDRHNFYKLPALADSRICKSPLPQIASFSFKFIPELVVLMLIVLTLVCLYSPTPILHPYPAGECRQKLR